MFWITLIGLTLTLLTPGSGSGAVGLDPQAQWGQWRGPLQTGVAPKGNPPLHWSEHKNIKWKAPIPGRGLSTPVIWGHRIFLTTAVPFGKTQAPPKAPAAGTHDNMPARQKHRFVVMAMDRRDGKVLWEHIARTAQPHEETHRSGSWASQSAVTDGEVVCASFGSQGIYCYTVAGELLWKKDLGDMDIFHGHGEGSSPALHGDTLVVIWDHQGASFLVALNKRTGRELWRQSRDEITSWASPVVVEHKEKPQVIVSATGRVRGYDLKTGEVLWVCGGLSRNVVATPVSAEGFVYAGSSYNTRALFAIRLDDARGDITATRAVAWTRTQDTPYVASPILYEGSLCYLRHLQGIMTCVEAKSGETQWGPQKLSGIRRVYASPVGAAGRIYVVGRQGTTVVVKRSPAFGVLARNKLDDTFGASPALVGSEIFLRGERFLYAIAETAPK